MSTAHSQEMTLAGDTIVDRTGRPTPIKLATAAQAFEADNTNTDVPASDSAQKAISSSPSAYDSFSAQGQPAEQLGGGTLRETSLPPMPVAIPPRDPLEPDYRTLVLCFDGTGDQFDADNSNIVQLVALLKKSDRSKQMVYYQVGLVFMKGFCFFAY